jgi:hypothetical protein
MEPPHRIFMRWEIASWRDIGDIRLEKGLRFRRILMLQNEDDSAVVIDPWIWILGIHPRSAIHRALQPSRIVTAREKVRRFHVWIEL